jgi:cell division protein FtsB
VAAAVLVVVGGLSAMPLRGLLSQRGAIADVEAELAEVRSDNDRLERRLTVLDDPAEIQRIARREYGLVDVGEESYSILPPATAGVVLPNAWPFDVLADSIAVASAGTGG